MRFPVLILPSSLIRPIPRFQLPLELGWGIAEIRQEWPLNEIERIQEQERTLEGKREKAKKRHEEGQAPEKGQLSKGQTREERRKTKRWEERRQGTEW